MSSGMNRNTNFLPLSPMGWRGIVIPIRPGSRWQLAAARLWGTHISETFFVQSSMKLCRPEVVQRHSHFLICLVWANNLLNLAPVESRLFRMHISETHGQIYNQNLFEENICMWIHSSLKSVFEVHLATSHHWCWKWLGTYQNLYFFMIDLLQQCLRSL